jgi:hypothetical protein
VNDFDGRPEYTIPEDAIDGSMDNDFDASNSVDLLSDSTNTLSYHWLIVASDFNLSQISTNMPGSRILQIPANSLPQLNEPIHPGPTDASLYWRVQLVVRHIPYTAGVVPAQQSVYWFRFKYDFSSLDISLATWYIPYQNDEFGPGL